MDVDLLGERGNKGPLPAWRLIDAARRAGISGELRLDVQPAASVWLRDGEVYFAEFATDGAIGIRLLVDGLVSLQQLQRGTVTVNGVEHIGRLFDLEPTLDRHVVEVAVEQMTEQALTRLAMLTVEHYTVAMYRRHPSGLDRWAATRGHHAPLRPAPLAVPTERRSTEVVPVAEPAPVVPVAITSDAPTLRPAPLSVDAVPPNRVDPATPATTDDHRPIASRIDVTPPLRVVPAAPTPPVVAIPTGGTPTLPTSSPVPITAGHSSATSERSESVPIVIDPDPTPVQRTDTSAADGVADLNGPVSAEGSAHDPIPDAAHDPGHDPTVAMPRLAPRPDDMPDPTPTTLVKHIAAAVRDAVAKVDGDTVPPPGA